MGAQSKAKIAHEKGKAAGKIHPRKGRAMCGAVSNGFVQTSGRARARLAAYIYNQRELN